MCEVYKIETFMVVAMGSVEEGMESYYLTDMEFQFWKINVLEMGGDEGCTILRST